MHIPAVQDIIRKSIKHRAREKMKRKTRRWCSRSLTIEHLGSPSSYGLPLDIKYIILDHLSHTDIQNALVALGWQIPDQYWCSRFPKDIIWEIEELAHTTADVTWQFLCLEAELLLESSLGLQNRQRIVQVLRGTRSLFFAAAGSGSCKREETGQFTV